MGPHMVHRVADLAKGLVAERARQALAPAACPVVLRVALGQDLHNFLHFRVILLRVVGPASKFLCRL